VPAEAAVRDPEHTPYIISSDDKIPSRVLAEQWPLEEILDGLP
jgi:hypothetical protein